MTRELQPCGTRAAYARHLDHGEPPCPPCLEANRDYRRPDRRIYGRARSLALIQLRARHTREFNRLYALHKQAIEREHGTAIQKRGRARVRALQELTRQHPDEFRDLLEAEHEKAKNP